MSGYSPELLQRLNRERRLELERSAEAMAELRRGRAEVEGTPIEADRFPTRLLKWFGTRGRAAATTIEDQIGPMARLQAVVAAKSGGGRTVALTGGGRWRVRFGLRRR